MSGRWVRCQWSVGGSRLGLSEHVAGTNLPQLLARLNAHDPGLVVELHLGTSAALLAQFDERRLDAVIIRYGADEPPRDDAQALFSEPLGWLATPEWLPRVGEPLALALLSPPCNVRDVALHTLNEAGLHGRKCSSAAVWLRSAPRLQPVWRCRRWRAEWRRVD